MCSPIDRHDVSPGDSIPDACTSRGFCASRPIRKSANDPCGGCSFGRMPLPPRRRSSSVSSGSSSRAGSRKRLDRDAVGLVVVLPLLEPDGRAQRHVAEDRPGEVDAEAVPLGVRQRIDQAVDEPPLRGHELHVLAAARVDGEPLAAERRRHLVGVEAGGVHHTPGRDGLGGRAQADGRGPRRRRRRPANLAAAPRRAPRPAAPAPAPAPRR